MCVGGIIKVLQNGNQFLFVTSVVLLLTKVTSDYCKLIMSVVICDIDTVVGDSFFFLHEVKLCWVDVIYIVLIVDDAHPNTTVEGGIIASGNALARSKEVVDSKPLVDLKSVNRRTDNIMAKRKRTKGQTTIYNTYT